jgi:hypothetical protein
MALSGEALDKPLNKTFSRRRRFALEGPGRLWATPSLRPALEMTEL